MEVGGSLLAVAPVLLQCPDNGTFLTVLKAKRLFLYNLGRNKLLLVVIGMRLGGGQEGCRPGPTARPSVEGR